MVDKLKATGMVLSVMPVGDYDRRLVLLTKEYGRITAFARGARRPNNALHGTTQPFAFGEFMLTPGKSAYSLLNANISEYFLEVREDFEAAYYGFYFLEMANYFSRENSDETEMLKLLYQTMRIMCKKTVPAPLVRRIFELKAFVTYGVYPECYHCMDCGSSENLIYFSPMNCGVVCGHCRNKNHNLMPIHESTLYTMQYIISAGIEKLYTFNVSDDVLKEFSKIMDRYRKIHMDKPMKSLEVLESIAW